MAITTSLCNVAKIANMRGRNSVGHTFNMALYHDAASLNSATTRYLTANEIGTGVSAYTATGQAITGLAMTVDANNAIMDFDDVSWLNSTFTCAGALLYNGSSSSKEALAVFDFGSTKQVSAGTFTLRLPVPASGTALMEIDS